MQASNSVCPFCVRQVYSMATFQGWRIIDLDVYVRDAWNDYGIGLEDLQLWTFRDNEVIGTEVLLAKRPVHSDDWRVSKPPPHHRSTWPAGSP
jgi:hypothetical protein